MKIGFFDLAVKRFSDLVRFRRSRAITAMKCAARRKFAAPQRVILKERPPLPRMKDPDGKAHYCSPLPVLSARVNRPPPRPFFNFRCKQSTFVNRPLGLPWATLGWPLGHAWATQTQTRSPDSAEGRKVFKNTKRNGFPLRIGVNPRQLTSVLHFCHSLKDDEPQLALL
jgi:hypothetical protein